MTTKGPIFRNIVQTADEWLTSVAREFNTDDRNFAYRVLRAWLHGLRDELPVDLCAHFAAQLPEVLRGVYYEGWDPSKVPVKHDLDAYVQRFAHEAQVRPSEVGHVASTVTAALRRHMSGTQLATAIERLPQRLREMLWIAPSKPTAQAGEPHSVPLEDRLALLETRVQTLTEVMRELVHGLEQPPVQEPTENHLAQAARRAHQILLAG